MQLLVVYEPILTGCLCIAADCTHSIDQGAICHNDDQPSQMALPTCQGCGGGGCASAGTDSGDFDTPLVFACIQYYSTECVFDVVSSQAACVAGNDGSIFDRLLLISDQHGPQE